MLPVLKKPVRGLKFRQILDGQVLVDKPSSRGDVRWKNEISVGADGCHNYLAKK